MNVVNNKMTVLTGIYNDNVKSDWNINQIVDDILVNPIMTPAIAGNAVTIKDSKGNSIDVDTIRQNIINCCDEGIDPIAETFTKDLLGQCLVNWDTNSNLPIVEMFPLQAGTEAGLPEPTDSIVYTPAIDVIPTMRKYISGQASYAEMFASLAYFARPETLGFYFLNEVAFDEFIKWFDNQTNMIVSMVTPETNRLFTEFKQLKLTDLTESLILRKDNGDSLEPLSFSRILINLLMNYTKIVGPAEYGIMPFNLSELICPKTVIFVNLEKHAKASANRVREEWEFIDKALHRDWKANMVSNNKLNKLTALDKKIAMYQHKAVSAKDWQDDNYKQGKIVFKKEAPTSADIVKSIKKLLDKMAFVNTSMNTYKQVKMSFAKPNRRDPDDFNKQGKITSTKYKPDIHIYIDTSGSISERDYRDAVKACIALAKKYNINMYFNSFSHIMSQTTKLNLQGKSVAQIYKEFQKVPKVSGGTNYENIWRFINSSKKRTRELSLLITDFEYKASTHYCRHPKNLYYFPCSTMDWSNIKYWAENFIKSMLHNDKDIRRHIMF